MIARWNRFLVLLLAAGLLAVTVPVQAEIRTLGEAINKAGRQRMLTQRMLKNYALIGMQIQPEKAREELAAAIALFDRQLRELQDYAPTAAIRMALDRVEERWLPFRQQIRQTPNPRAARDLLAPNDALLQAAHQVVLLLEDFSGTPGGRLVNMAGRQRMLSQRLAGFYMLRAWGIDNAAIRSETRRARNEFQGAMSELRAAPGNTPDIRKALDQARAQWNLFRHALDRKGDDFVPLIVAVTSESLLATMDRVTAMYARLEGQR